MKKIIALILSVVMVVACFAACGNKTAGNGDVTVIKVWSSSGSTQEAMKKLVEEFNNGQGKKDGIQIEYTTYLNDYATIIESAAQNDTLPDLLMIPGDQNKINYAKKGDIVEIDSMPGGKEFREEYGEESLEGKEMIDGKVYYLNMAQTVQGMIYNKDLFKKAGLTEPPKTMTEFIEYAKKLTDKKNNIYGTGYPMKDQFWSAFVANPFGTVMAKDSQYGEMSVIDWDKQTVTFNSEYLKKKYDLIKQLKECDAYFPGPESLDNDTLRAQFAAGRIGMFIGASWDVGVLTEQFPATCDWAVAPVPVPDGMERYQNPSSRSSGYCISKTAKTHPEKAMEVYTWLMGKDVMQALYEGGYYIPIRKDAAEAADVSKMPAQWVQFAELVINQEDKKRYPGVSYELEGESTGDKQKAVWDGATNYDEMIADLNKTYTAALKKGIANGSIIPELYK